jgi:outer membrane protein insertion porin family
MKKLLISLAFPLISLSFYLNFNYQPGKNNFELLTREELEKVLNQLSAVENYNCTGKVCYVYLKPILESIKFQGFSIFTSERLRNYLALKEGFRYSEKQLLDTSKFTVFFLKNNGYIDATAKTELLINKRGLAKVKVKVKTGELYFWGGFKFKNACFKPKEFYKLYGKPLGTPFGYSELYEALDLSYILCKKKGYYRSFVYLNEPFEVKKNKLFSYFGKNFGIKFSYGFDFLSEYLNVLIQNPYKGIQFLFRKSNFVIPELVIEKGQKLQIEITGNRFFKKEKLLSEIKDFFAKSYFVSTALLAEYLTNLYKSYGFYDVFITIVKKGKKISIKINEGARYRVKIFLNLKSKISFSVKNYQNCYFSKNLIKELKKKLENFLYNRNLYYKTINITTEIDKRKKLVKLAVSIKGLEPFSVRVEKKLNIHDKGLRAYVKEFIEDINYKDIVFNRNNLKKLETKLKNALEDYGCLNPDVALNLKHPKRGIYKFTWNVSCKQFKRITKVVYWVDGRIRKRELDYMIPKCILNKKASPKYIDILTSHWQKTNLFQSLTVKRILKKGGKDIFLIEGTEKKPFHVAGTLGYETDQGFFSDISLYMFDLLKTGETFRLKWNISQKRNLYEFSYFDNYFFSEKYFAGFNIFKKYEEHNAYDLTAKGFSLTLGYHFNLYTDISLNLLNSEVELENGAEGSFNVWKINGILDFYYPIYKGLIKSGTFLMHFQGGFNTEEPHYTKAEGKVGLSYTFRRFYLEWKTSAGWVDKRAPIFEKFFLGGVKNLKGYSYESVAPPGGGEIYWYSGLELGIPITKGGPYIFGGTDLGNSVKNNQNPFKDIKKDIFLGAGALTRVGPIRGGIALPLEEKVSLKDIKLFFLVGFSF